MWILFQLAISARAWCALNVGVLIILLKSTRVKVVRGILSTSAKNSMMLSLQWVGSHILQLFRKQSWGQGIVATFAHCQTMNAELPVIGIKIDDVQCSALVDTGCSWFIVSADCYHVEEATSWCYDHLWLIPSMLWYRDCRNLWWKRWHSWSWHSGDVGKTSWLWPITWNWHNKNFQGCHDHHGWRYDTW